MRLAITAAALLLLTTLAGCTGGTGSDDAAVTRGDGWLEGAVWDTEGTYSRPLEAGPFGALPVDVDMVASFDGTPIATAVWRPDVPEGTPVPIILDIGPYYADDIGTLSVREQEFFIEGFVSHGYAYGRVAVRGSGQSGGCMEFFGINEQDDIDHIVTHFGSKEWSNGRVALYGASYDGTTPWIAASYGNPHVATIVPVVGLTDVAGLMFRNGTSESRGPIMHSVVYWTFFGVGAMDGGALTHRAPYWGDQVCEEFIVGAVEGPLTAATGDRRSEYWEVRDWRQRVLENYDGSVFVAHGLQDWNVEATMVYPFLNELEAKGNEVKVWLGQWGHDWPDRASRGDHVRWDYAEVLLRWFDRHLKELDVETGPAVDVQDQAGAWRTEQTWPPRDVEWTAFHPGDEGITLEPQAHGSAQAAHPGFLSLGSNAVVDSDWRFTSGPLEEDLRFAGLARLHATLTSAAPDGNLLARLYSVSPDDHRERVAWAVMNIRYHEGGHEPVDVMPDEPFLARMEFFPADVVVPAGHRLELQLVPNTQGLEPIPRAPAPMTLHWGDGLTVLHLPVIDRSEAVFGYPGMPDA